MTGQFVTLLGYMAVCSFTPGPGNILALNTTSSYGWKKAVHTVLGICIGYGIVQAFCTVAVYELNSVLAQALKILKYVGCIYMVWLAVHMMRSRPDISEEKQPPTFREGMLLQLVNVKIYFYILSLLSVYFIPNIPTVGGLVAAGIFAVSIGSLATIVWAALGAKLQNTYQRHYRVINIILGLFLIYCAVSMLRE